MGRPGRDLARPGQTYILAWPGRLCQRGGRDPGAGALSSASSRS